MPIIDLTVPAGAITADKTAALLDQLATVLLRAERAPDTEFFREVTWVYLHEVAAVAVGGRPGGAPRFRVDITVPAGALSERRKTELIAAAHDAVTGAAGIDPNGPAALHVFTLIREVPEGNWGAAGQPVKFEMLRAAASSAREEAHSR